MIAVGNTIRDKDISQGKDRKLFFREAKSEQALFEDGDKDPEPQVLSQLTNKYDSQHPISISEQAHHQAKAAQLPFDAPPRGFNFGGSN